ncbi:MAG: hypothetical protein MSIBF_04400 [Candidatus Altiarchaeales archaeon IMC4]|nr:MAG: hypothetical protein MSIBF_04400 [Candidatus Altiarchaeales archaeon IMC4]
MKLVLFSKQDPAGENIANAMIKGRGFREKGAFDGEPVYAQGDIRVLGVEGSVLELSDPGKFDEFSPCICVVASRHKSASGIPTLTCHSPGNFSTAEMGGSDRQLAVNPALYLRALALSMAENPPGDYSFTLEVTHHGPTCFGFPVVFAEVGSNEKHWGDPAACEKAASAIYESLSGEPEEKQVCIGFGGNHYAPKFTGALADFAVGHIMPKYAMDFLSEDAVREMAEKTAPKPHLALLDGKGIGKQKKELISILEGAGIGWEKL